MRRSIENWKLVGWFALALVLADCGDPKLKVGLNAGLAGADVGRMAATEVRMSGAARDRYFDMRVAAQTIIARGELTPAILRASLDSLVADESVAVIISRFLLAEELAAARNFSAQGMPFLSVAALPSGVASPNGSGFSLVPGLTEQAIFLAKQANAADRIAIVHIDNVYGTALRAELVNALNARGFKTAGIRQYQQSWDEPRVVALGTELERDSDPNLIYFIGRAPSLELIWQPFREAAKEVRVIGSDLVESTAIYANPQGRYTGLKYVRYFDPKSAEPRMKDLNDRYWMWISRGEMTGEAVLVYDGLMLVAAALRAGARERSEFVAYFASLGKTRPPFKGVGGLIEFTSAGQAQRDFELAEVTSEGVVSTR
ncbi:MAG: ABC transporter substrate-binding protein [Gemmatimonadota bacterium]